MYNGPTWWVLCMNRPAVCVIQYTPWTGISSYKRGTHFNVFTASNSIHVELHQLSHYHNNTTLQYCTEGCLHNITDKQGVSADDHCLTLRICIFDCIWLYFSHSYYGPALTLHICIYIFDCVFSLTLPTLLWSSWFQLYFTTRCDWWRTQRLLRGNDRSPFPSVAMLPFVLYCPTSCPTVFTISSLPYCHMSILYYLACICQWLILTAMCNVYPYCHLSSFLLRSFLPFGQECSYANHTKYFITIIYKIIFIITLFAGLV